MAGLLGDSWDDPRTMATLQMAAGLLSGGNFGQSMARGLGGYQQSMSDAAQAKDRKDLMDWKREEIDVLRKQRAADQAKRDALPSLFQGGSPALAPLMGDASVGIQPSAGRPAIAAQLDIQRALQAGYGPEEISKLHALGDLGKQEVSRTIKGIGPDGREVEYQVDKFGQPVGKPMAQYRAPLMQDLGGNVAALDPYTLQPKANFNKTQTFADRNAAGNLAVAQGNLGVSRERLNFDKMGGLEGGQSQAGLNKQFGKPQAGYRWKTDGSLEFIPGGPADQKAQGVKVGEGTVASVVADLRDKYDQLDQENGIVSTNNRFGTNFGAWMGSTDVGQTLNGMVGTKTQSSRDSIAMTRPLLLQAIMKATGMSAKQMDSNAELKMYLATATDPKKGLEANREALARIEALYGGGGEAYSSPSSATPSSSGWGIEKVNK